MNKALKNISRSWSKYSRVYKLQAWKQMQVKATITEKSGGHPIDQTANYKKATETVHRCGKLLQRYVAKMLFSAIIITDFSKSQMEMDRGTSEVLWPNESLDGERSTVNIPWFQRGFEIHTDASKLQLGACISQKGEPVAFYSRKLLPAQTRYKTTEREWLSIVETLKEFRNILLGQRIKVHTDHVNLTYKAWFNSKRVMRWRLYIEEYSPDLQYINGTHNVVADALSRLDIIEELLKGYHGSLPGPHGLFCENKNS